MPALRTAVEMALTAVHSELSSWVISPVPGKEGGLSYILKNRDRELEASRPRCRRFLLQRAQRPGPSFLKPLPLLPSLLEQCGAQAAAVEDRPAAAAPAAAEKEGGKHKAGCELRAAR